MKCEKCNSEIIKVAYNCDIDDIELWDCFCECGHKLIGFEIENNNCNDNNEGEI